MAKPTTAAKKAAPAKPRRHQDAMAFLASMESVAVAEDKKVSVDAPVQKDNKEDLTAAVTPNEEVAATDKGVATQQPGPANGGGDGTAVTQEVGKVTAKQTTDAGNAGEEDAVSGKTPDQVKAGEKDLTTGVVSQEDNIEANEAEHITPKEADDAVMNVDHAVTQLEESGVTLGAEASLQKAEAVGHDLENINKVEVALEAYQGMLRDLKAKGRRPTPELIQAISVGLNSHDRAFFKPVIASLEDYARPDTHLVASMGLEAAIGEKMKELGKAAGNAVMKIIEMLMDAWNHLRRDTPKLIEELDKLGKGLQSANLDTSKQVSVKGASRLMINGEFAGDSVEVVRNVEKVSRELLAEWPNALIKLVNVAEGKSKQVATTGGADNKLGQLGRSMIDSREIEEAAQAALEATFHSFKQVDAGEAPSKLSSFSIITRSPILPGNHAMFIGINDGTNASVNVADSKHFMGFAFERTGDRDGGGAEVSLPSPERATAALKGVRDIVGNLIAKDTSMNQLKELRKKLNTEAGTKEGDVTRGAIQAALMSHRSYMGWLISLVKSYIGFYGEVLGNSAGTDVAVRKDGAAAKTNGKTQDRTKEADDASVVSTQ